MEVYWKHWKKGPLQYSFVCLQISPCCLILQLEQGKKGLENTKMVAILALMSNIPDP